MDILETLELAHHLRECAYETEWVDYAERMLQAAIELEKLVYQNEAAIQLPSLIRQ